MLCPQNVPLILGRSLSEMNAPSLAGFRFTPPRLTSSVSSMGVITRLPPLRRRSSSILSPTSLPTASMAVAMVMPRAMAKRATLLRLFCRRNDSNSRRKNISVRELRELRLQVRQVDHDGVALLDCMQRNGIAASRLAHALRVNGSGAVLTDYPGGTLVEPDRAADLAGIEKRCHLAIWLAIKQEAHLHTVHISAKAAQVAFGQIFRRDYDASTAVKGDLGGRGKRRQALGVNEFRRHHEDEDECSSHNQVGPKAFASSGPLLFPFFSFAASNRNGCRSSSPIFQQDHQSNQGQHGDREEIVIADNRADHRHLAFAGRNHACLRELVKSGDDQLCGYKEQDHRGDTEEFS